MSYFINDPIYWEFEAAKTQAFADELINSKESQLLEEIVYRYKKLAKIARDRSQGTSYSEERILPTFIRKINQLD